MAKKAEKIYREISSEKEPKTRAVRVRMLLKKNKGIFKDKEALTDFKEPVLFLRRRSGSTEIYEDASKGSFYFTHSNGENRETYLEPSTQGTMDYGKRKFKYYFCHEDYPLPLPENPLVTASTINEIVEKAGMDMKRLGQNKKEELKLRTIKTLLWFGALAAVIFILWKTHAFEKIIGLFTGQPYVDAAVATATKGGTNTASIIQNNSLAITST